MLTSTLPTKPTKTNVLNPNACVNPAASLLYTAAFEGHMNIIEWLLEKKVDINAVTSQGSSALHAAATGGYLDICKVRQLFHIQNRQHFPDSCCRRLSPRTKSLRVFPSRLCTKFSRSSKVSFGTCWCKYASHVLKKCFSIRGSYRVGAPRLCAY